MAFCCGNVTNDGNISSRQIMFRKKGNKKTNQIGLKISFGFTPTKFFPKVPVPEWWRAIEGKV
jgi:hypothetical protein